MPNTADVIRTALTLGYRRVCCGGERQVLQSPTWDTDAPPSLGRPQPTMPADAWMSAVQFLPCAWCQTVCCVHGAKLGALRHGKRIYCTAECCMQASNARRRAARQEVRR